jgi:hypothetical protein
MTGFEGGKIDNAMVRRMQRLTETWISEQK